LRKFSARYLKEVFVALPPLAKLLLIFGLVNALLIVGTASVKIVSWGNMATIRAVNVGVYWDEGCICPVDVAPGVNLTSGSPAPLAGAAGIDWGLMGLGETKRVDVYVKNEGASECTLEIYAEEWDPELAGDYIGLTSDYQGQVLGTEDGDSVLKVTLILYVPMNIHDVTTFKFQVVIQATG
jgi:hypothetical protein